MQFLPHASAEQLRMFEELQRVSASAENAARILTAFDLIDVSQIAPRVCTPTLVPHSNGDARIPFEEGPLLATLISGARFVPIASANHVPLEGDPAFDRLFEDVEGFLSTTAGSEVALLFRSLTPREREVLSLIALGLTNEKVARRRGIGEETVRDRLTARFGRLGVSNRGEAFFRAREAGFGTTGVDDRT